MADIEMMRSEALVMTRNGEDRYHSYVAGCISTGKKRAPSPARFDRAVRHLEAAFTSIYRAVAVDVDGTLTKGGSHEIDADIAAPLTTLIARGVPIVLVTGRGRTSVRWAANEIKNNSGLSEWYLRRLRCITHNGIFYLSTPADDPSAFLSVSTQIAEPVPFLDDLYQAIITWIQTIAEEFRTTVTLEPSSEEGTNLAIRVAFPHSKAAELRIFSDLTRILYSIDPAELVTIRKGGYAELTTFDIAATSKGKALEHFAREIGVSKDQILRIGDQGQEGGNDFDLLNCLSGFSVGSCSGKLGVCHPVLDDACKIALTGAAATTQLLNRVLLFPPISIEPAPVKMRIKSLRAFEGIALKRAREEMDILTHRLRVRLHYLLRDEAASWPLSSIGIGDIFDQRSGGIRFRDWELDSISEEHPAWRHFELGKLFRVHGPGEDPRTRRAMYTDTGILMRGPDYYYSLTRQKEDITLKSFLTSANELIRSTELVVGRLVVEDPDLTRFKLLAALLDNTRNVLILLQYVAYMSERKLADGEFLVTRSVFRDFLVPHTEVQFDLFLNPDASWEETIEKYQSLLRSMPSGFEAVARLDHHMDPADIRRWRECDHFLENVTAVQLGLNRLRGQMKGLDTDLLAVGLVYGATELPAIATVVAKALHVGLTGGYCDLSIYRDKGRGRAVRRGKADYVRRLQEANEPIFKEDETSSVEGRYVVLLDDNCMTGVTMQTARDMFIYQRAQVIGAIVVRYPGSNRRAHMAMAGHGHIDPEMLFSFIRGLVVPSPYVRLLYENKGRGNQRYLDKFQMFDKSRERIKIHLAKNGTPVVND